MLTAEDLSKVLSYDSETGALEWISPCWRANKGECSHIFNSASGKTYRRLNYNKKIYMAHRIIWLLHTGSWPVGQIDHINGDGTDNRISNLRDVSPYENHKNVKLLSNNKSGTCGVYWCSTKNRWLAKITVNKKLILIGVFSIKSDAIDARKKAEIEYGFHPNHGTIRAL